MVVTNEFEAHRVHIKPEGNFGEPGQGSNHEPGDRTTIFVSMINSNHLIFAKKFIEIRH